MERQSSCRNGGEFEDLFRNVRAGSQEDRRRVLEVCHIYLLKIAHQRFPPKLRAKGEPAGLVRIRSFAGFCGISRVLTQDDKGRSSKHISHSHFTPGPIKFRSNPDTPDRLVIRSWRSLGFLESHSTA